MLVAEEKKMTQTGPECLDSYICGYSVSIIRNYSKEKTKQVGLNISAEEDCRERGRTLLKCSAVSMPEEL